MTVLQRTETIPLSAPAAAAQHGAAPKPAATSAAPPPESAVPKEEDSRQVSALFTPFKMGRFELQHRMVYPPLTRTRASVGNVPNPDLMTQYYTQRATPGGLMISEGTYVSSRSAAYYRASGIWTDEQRDAWRPIVKAVKDKGAVFFCQLFHCGRAAHPDLIGGQRPLAPSPIPPGGTHSKAALGEGRTGELPVPEELTLEGIQQVVDEYRQAARRAVDAGFDGVEIHGANGYLVAQFTNSRSNKRADAYGGSIENRCRFGLEVARAVAEEIGADRVGYRMSPFTNFLDCIDEESPYATYMYLTEQLNKLGLAYVHMVEGRVRGNFDVAADHPVDTLEPFRKVWKGAFIAAGSYNGDNAGPAVASGHADLVAFGRLWIANPDLPRRFQQGAPLNAYDRRTFYTHGPEGYTDYPFLPQ